jgi:preprotein translocase subunit Sec63
MSGSSKPNRGASNRCPYATLNLLGPDCSGINQDPTRAQVSDDDIRDAYKKLSRLLHPDKRSPGKEREDAQEIFTELMNACELMQDVA